MTPPAGKADAQELLNQLLPFAEKMLRDHGEFFPFGGHMKPDGDIVWEGASTGIEQPPSQDLINILRTEHRKMAIDGTIQACAMFYDVLIVPPGRTKKQDAIAVELDHSDGYSAIVYFPYHLETPGDLHVGAPFSNRGNQAIFVGGIA